MTLSSGSLLLSISSASYRAGKTMKTLSLVKFRVGLPREEAWRYTALRPFAEAQDNLSAGRADFFT
jgi:hypothetical protein